MVDNDHSHQIGHVEGSSGLEFNTTRVAAVGVPAAVLIVAGLVYLTSVPTVIFVFYAILCFAYALHSM